MPDLILPRGQEKILKADDKDYERGLLVKLLDNGGYSMKYWYETTDKAAPVEVLVDVTVRNPLAHRYISHAPTHHGYALQEAKREKMRRYGAASSVSCAAIEV